MGRLLAAPEIRPVSYNINVRENPETVVLYPDHLEMSSKEKKIHNIPSSPRSSGSSGSALCSFVRKSLADRIFLKHLMEFPLLRIGYRSLPRLLCQRMVTS